MEKAAGAAAAVHLFHGAENGPTPMFPEEDDEGDDTQGESHTGRVMGQNVIKGLSFVGKLHFVGTPT